MFQVREKFFPIAKSCTSDSSKPTLLVTRLRFVGEFSSGDLLHILFVFDSVYPFQMQPEYSSVSAFLSFFSHSSRILLLVRRPILMCLCRWHRNLINLMMKSHRLSKSLRQNRFKSLGIPKRFVHGCPFGNAVSVAQNSLSVSDVIATENRYCHSDTRKKYLQDCSFQRRSRHRFSFRRRLDRHQQSRGWKRCKRYFGSNFRV